MDLINMCTAAIVFFSLIQLSGSSIGDRSYIFSKCLMKCSHANCSGSTNGEIIFSQKQPLHLKTLQWSCEDECKYNCMWHTVKAFQDDGSLIPQFYGKWPFVRYAGIQEPASMLFSVLNALCHLAILHFRAKVLPTAPMYHIWHGMSVVGIVTWMCAALFHTRDFPITEKLDYFSAFGLVLYNLFTLLARLNVGRERRLLYIPATMLISLYIYHIYCLHDHFDYGYNMLVNLTVGAVNAIGWVVWCLYQYRLKRENYVFHGALVVVALSLLLTLELFDFPPLLWALDAHALWHAGTVPLTLWWYRFIIADSIHLSTKDGDSSSSKEMKKTV